LAKVSFIPADSARAMVYAVIILLFIISVPFFLKAPKQYCFPNVRVMSQSPSSQRFAIQYQFHKKIRRQVFRYKLRRKYTIIFIHCFFNITAVIYRRKGYVVKTIY
jgi:hypothetical protein